jgi:hypothetical protein
MSGNAVTSPTYYFSGINFNPSFYTSSSSDYLTKQTAKSYFLSYPTAQGTETISKLNCAVLSVWAIAGVLLIKPYGVYIGTLYMQK